MTDDRFKALREARWYSLDRDGVAMLCKDEADAKAQAAEADACWPARAPHRAVLLGDVEFYAAQIVGLKPLVQAVRNVLEEGQIYAEDLTLLRLALEQVDRAHG